MRLTEALLWLAPAGWIAERERRKAIDLTPVSILREASESDLLDPAALERDVLPRLGLTLGTPEYFPPELQRFRGQGLRCYQYPNQLAPYLTTLAVLPIRSYLELGVFDGGTFIATVEYLRRVGQVDRAIAVDVDAMRAVRAYGKSAPWVDVAQLASGTPAFDALISEANPDLVLIDGDHSLAAVRRDLASVVDHAAVAIAMHDIADTASPGVRQTWDRFRAEGGAEWEFHEFTAQYAEVTARFGGTAFGLGLAVRKSRLETSGPATRAASLAA